MPKEESNKRKQQAIATRKKILNTSIRLIREMGYEQVTVDHICEACGLSKGAFYHHFKSKLDIISESETELNEMLEDVYRDNMEESFKERILIFINSMLAAVEKSGVEVTRQRTFYVVGGEYIHEDGSKIFAITSRQLLCSIIRQAMDRNELKADTPVDALSEIIMIFITGLIADWCIFSGSYSLTERSWTLSMQLIQKLFQDYYI
jgi:AcrR family transcriptional regulator